MIAFYIFTLVFIVINRLHVLLFIKTFPLCSTSAHLYSALARERLSIEMVQIWQTEDKQIAIFHSDLNDILFGSPHIIREKETRVEYISMILHTTQHFPVEILKLKNALDIKKRYFIMYQIILSTRAWQIHT